MKKSERLARAAAARAALFGDDDAPAPQEPVSAPRAHEPKAPTGSVRRHGLPSAGNVRSPARGERGGTIAAHVTTPREALAHLIPKNWPTPPQIGDLVFYHGDRMWVEWAPPNWEGTLHIRIRDSRVPRGSDGRPQFDRLTDKCVSQCVHPDLCTAVPADYNQRATRLPTVAGVARKERAKQGIKDTGDDVALMLRSCDTLDKVYKAASAYLAVAVDELKAKYSHLNNGQQRMNLGNRMRSKWRKEHV